MPETFIRNANLADYPAIAAVAVATGQDEEWGGADPAYLDYLMNCGRVVVATSAGSVTGSAPPCSTPAAPSPPPPPPSREASPATWPDGPYSRTGGVPGHER